MWSIAGAPAAKPDGFICQTVASFESALLHKRAQNQSLQASLASINSSSSSSSKLSKDNPLCASAAYHTIHVVVPYYNLTEKTLQNALRSVQMQHYPNDRIQIWLYEDGILDEREVETRKANNDYYSYCRNQKPHLFAPISLNQTKNRTDVSRHVKAWMAADDNTDHTVQQQQEAVMHNRMPRTHCIQSTEHLGPAGSKFWIFQIVKYSILAGPNDIVMVLDGDDELLHPQGLTIINQKYLDTNAWFTYGSMEGRWSEQIVDLPDKIRSGEQSFRPRQQPWLYGHPRTLKLHLLDHVPSTDFQYSSGNDGHGQWLQKGTERGFMFRCLELAGVNRIGYIAEKIYKYNFSPVSSTIAMVPVQLQKEHIEHSSKGMNATDHLLQLPIHVVLTVWKQMVMLHDQLTFLQKQIHLKGRVIHVHVLNNNQEKRSTVDTIVQDFSRWQQQQQASAMSKMEQPPIAVTLVHMLDIDEEHQLHHNFARFVYIDQLRRTTPIDEVIFLDDDQYWEPTFVASLLKSHKPKGMTTWYGKKWIKQNELKKTNKQTPKNNDLAKYWYPSVENVELLKKERWPEINTFKYGGAGGSIYDTNLWLLDAQLQRPARDLKKWAKIDDLWASYVLDALLGWEIRRLGPPAPVPMDVGDFQKKGAHFQFVYRTFDKQIREMLHSKYMMPKAGPLIADVATWNDPTVNKQEMFSELQTSYMWEVFDFVDLKPSPATQLRKTTKMEKEEKQNDTKTGHMDTELMVNEFLASYPPPSPIQQTNFKWFERNLIFILFISILMKRFGKSCIVRCQRTRYMK